MTVFLGQISKIMKRVKNTETNLVPEAAMAYQMPLRIEYNSRTNSEMDILKLIKNGIPKKSLDNTMQMMGFTLDQMAAVLHVSERTLRRYAPSDALNIEQSERIVELNNLYQYGSEVFGNIDAFKIWIESPLLALGQQAPKQFLDTSYGILMLKNILGRIERGVYS